MSLDARRLAELAALNLAFTPRELKALTAPHQAAVLLLDETLGDLVAAFTDLAKGALLTQMMALSRAHEGTAWAAELEYALWEALVEGPERLTEAEVRTLRRLAAWAGGWYHLPDEAEAPEFVPAAAWAARYARHVAYANDRRRAAPAGG